MNINDIKIVFEDDSLLIVNKPSGFVVNKSDTTKGLVTLQDWILQYLGQKALPWGMRHGLVHRLDKDTSGLLIIAKTKEDYDYMLNVFKNRLIQKKYYALVHGIINPADGNIQLPIKRDPRNRKKFSVQVGGKMAITYYKLKTIYFNPKQKIKSKKYFSLVDINIKTGRTHQIRVHFNHLHHPVVSDQIYAGKKTKRADKNWCPRLFLQSYFLQFADKSGADRQYSIDLDNELAGCLSSLSEYDKQ